MSDSPFKHIEALPIMGQKCLLSELNLQIVWLGHPVLDKFHQFALQMVFELHTGFAYISE